MSEELTTIQVVPRERPVDVIHLGVSGPPGTGVTSAEKAELFDRVSGAEAAIDAIELARDEGTVFKNNGTASTTSTAGVDVSVLSLDVGEWEIWEVTWYLPGGSTGAAGQTLSFTGPSGAVLRGTAEASSATAGVDLTRPIPALGTKVSGGFLPSTLVGVMVVRGVYVGSGNAGTLRVRLHAVTSGQSANVSTQSHMLARRIS